MKALCVIPARGGSKNIPKKNITIVHGRPLIGFVIEAVLESHAFDRTIVSTDSEEIAEVVKSHYPGMEIPFIRPVEFSGDNAPVTAAIKHAVEFFKDEDYELVFSVQPTNPFTRPETLVDMLSIMRRGKCDSVITIAKIIHCHPFRSYGYDFQTMKISPLTDHTSERYLQKQERPDAYGLTGGVFARKAGLLKGWDGAGFALGKDRRGYVVSQEEAFDLDTPFEMELFNGIIAQRHRKALCV